jgi:CheY-like chemotaxis protein
MVYGFAKQSGGHVAIESRVGSGTRVTFYIPQSEARVGSADAESRIDVPRGSGESVLLVEDDPAVRKLVSNILKDLGYQVTEARDGEVALALFEGVGTFDLLLSDVVLPGSYSGRDLATVVRVAPQTVWKGGAGAQDPIAARFPRVVNRWHQDDAVFELRIRDSRID